jgi:hypothetical protein
MVLCALALLWKCAAAQRLTASTCLACVAINSASIYSDMSGGQSVQDPQIRGVYSTGIGIPTAVWCSVDPTGISGSCSDTSFIVANLQTQCGGWNAANASEASPCPASSPYAFFQACDCARNCAYQGLAFDGYGSPPFSKLDSYRSFVPDANVVNLLRSCDLCVAAGGEWWSASDLMSNACSNVTYQKLNDQGEGPSSSYTQTVVPSCHKPGQRFTTVDSKVPDVNIFQAAFRYSTSYQCSHGSSFCSSGNLPKLPGVQCIIMIVLLVNVPCTAIYMGISRIIFKILVSHDSTPGSMGSGFCHTVLKCIGWMCAIYHHFNLKSATTLFARVCYVIAEYLVTYVLWPILPSISFTFIVCFISGLVLYLLCVPLVAFCKCCCVTQPSTAKSPARFGLSSGITDVAMV